MAIVEVEGLCRDFDGVAALREVSFSVERGEMFGIVGPDGAGKTTLLRLLAGVLELKGGRARLLGRDLASEPEAIKQGTGYIPEQFSLYDDLTVRENLRFFADLYDVDRTTLADRVAELLRVTRLSEFTDRLAGDLSGGMRKKLSLATVLLPRPELLIMDEPTRGVDPVSRRDLWELFQRYLGRGVTFVLATSSLPEAERCSRVGLLYEGSFLRMDTPRALKDAYEPSVLEIRLPRAHRWLDPLRERLDPAQVNLFGGVLHAAGTDPDRMHRVARELLSAGDMPEYTLEFVEPGLEDVFIDVLSAEDREGRAGHEPGF